MYAFMDACVVIFALLNEQASISRLDNCNVQPTFGYIRHFFYLSVVYFLVMGGLDDLVRPLPPSRKNEQSNTSIGLLLCVVALCLVALSCLPLLCGSLKIAWQCTRLLCFCCSKADASWFLVVIASLLVMFTLGLSPFSSSPSSSSSLPFGSWPH